MHPPPADIVNTYTALLEHAIIKLRSRLWYGDTISGDELQDWLDALHNIPIMLRYYGGWHVEENIDSDLARYDSRWFDKSGSDKRRSLLGLLQEARRGDYDRPE